MLKKLFIAAAVFGASINVVAQTEGEMVANPKEMATNEVMTFQKTLLENMKIRLENSNKAKVDFGSLQEDKSQQFLYNNELVAEKFKLKKTDLERVFKKMVTEKNVPNQFSYEEIRVGKLRYDKQYKNGDIDSSECVVPVTFQAHTISKDSASNVKYAVTFEWAVEFDEKKGKITGVNDVELISSTVEEIEFLMSDRKNMQSLAKTAVEKWYASLPSTLDSKYASQSIKPISPIKVGSNDIQTELPKNRNINVKQVPAIKVNIDHTQFIDKNELALYEGCEAALRITPSFDIKINDDMTRADIVNVSYNVVTEKPVSPKEKSRRHNIASQIAKDFANKLSVYVSSPDKDGKKALVEMFSDNTNDINVSHVSIKGEEKIKTVTAEQYLSRLRGETLDITMGELIVEDANWNTLIYQFDQKYLSKTYGDNTQKKIYLVYDSEKDTYSIEKIEVVPNSTQRIVE